MPHSRSPWRHGRGGYADSIYDDGDPPQRVCELIYNYRPRDEILANAALIETAPELLGLCERMLRGDFICGFRQEMRQLVLRAGGEVPEE